jgi:hypothetical protein
VTLFNPAGQFAERVDAFFAKLATPVDPATELGESGVSGRGQLAIVGKVTTGIGLACFLMLLATAPGHDRIVILIYSASTTIVGLIFVLAGRVPQAAAIQAPALASGNLGVKD